MITFLLLGFFIVLGLGFGLVAYTSNNRKRAGMKGTPSTPPTGHSGEPAGHTR
ncbi:hypothetical protein ACFQBQ_02130 [Granulicella cerasi]|uniref:Uncharacterized protein n=1 Tax=Granulicella cerasi TaxID=741063 RepID=A0ABW1Z8B9_9BACT|nr:hypothetical protein [Granulicella cerasi]